MQPQSNPFGASRKDHQEFIDRFRQGPQAVSQEEAASRYEQVASNLPPEVYHQSAQEVFAQLSPEQRMQLGQALIQSAREQGQSFPDVNQDGIDDRLQDPDYLAQTTVRVQQKRPGLLSRILGGGTARRSTGEETPADSTPPATPQVGAPQVGTGGMLGNPMAKGILGGIAAAGLMNMLTGPHYYSGGLFGPPVMGGYFGGGPMFFGGGPVFGGYGFGEGYEEGYEEGLEEGFEGDFGGGDFGGGDFGGGDF
jgi:hypothetical protein